MPAGKRKNTRNMHTQRTAFFDEGKAQSLDSDPEVRKLSHCHLCHEPIDYQVPAGTTGDSHHLDHFLTVEDRPDLQEEWDNFRHSHQACNLARGNNPPSPGLGEAMPQWW